MIKIRPHDEISNPTQAGLNDGGGDGGPFESLAPDSSADLPAPVDKDEDGKDTPYDPENPPLLVAPGRKGPNRGDSGQSSDGPIPDNVDGADEFAGSGAVPVPEEGGEATDSIPDNIDPEPDDRPERGPGTPGDPGEPRPPGENPPVLPQNVATPERTPPEKAATPRPETAPPAPMPNPGLDSTYSGPVISALDPGDVHKPRDLSDSPVVNFTGELWSDNEIRSAEARDRAIAAGFSIAYSPVAAILSIFAKTPEQLYSLALLGGVIWTGITPFAGASRSQTSRASSMANQIGYVPGGLPKDVEERWFPEKGWVDMRDAPPGTPVNSTGQPRDSRWFFPQSLELHPEFYSVENMVRIGEGRNPVIDAIFLESFPEFEIYEGDKLVHHHIDLGPFAAPIPESMHFEFYPELHFTWLF